MNLLIRDVPQEDWQVALGAAKAYLRDYPEGKVGFHAGVVYLTGLEPISFYVYKTKTQIVVRGS